MFQRNAVLFFLYCLALEKQALAFLLMSGPNPGTKGYISEFLNPKNYFGKNTPDVFQCHAIP
jgi:hypothetical protein